MLVTATTMGDAAICDECVELAVTVVGRQLGDEPAVGTADAEIETARVIRRARISARLGSLAPTPRPRTRTRIRGKSGNASGS